MRLEQMRAIAAPLGLELPPLAGAAPSWVFVPPAFEGVEAGALAANAIATMTTPNQLQTDAPTKMVEWAFTAINLVVGLNCPSGEAEKTAFTQKVIAQMLIGSDVVWSGQGEGSGTLPAGKAAQSEIRIAADLLNSVVLPTGRALQLRFLVSTSIPTTSTKLFLNPPAPATAPSQSSSSYTYNIHMLSGHRVLS